MLRRCYVTDVTDLPCDQDVTKERKNQHMTIMKRTKLGLNSSTQIANDIPIYTYMICLCHGRGYRGLATALDIRDENMTIHWNPR